MKKINYNFYTQFKHLIKTFNSPLPQAMISCLQKAKEQYQLKTALAVWLAIQTKLFTTKGRAWTKSTKIGKVSELLQMQAGHLKVNSIRFSAEANSVMTESWKDLVSMTSVSNWDSMDIRPKSESLSCFILFWENDLIRFKEENDLLTDLGLYLQQRLLFFIQKFFEGRNIPIIYPQHPLCYIAVVIYFDKFKFSS